MSIARQFGVVAREAPQPQKEAEPVTQPQAKDRKVGRPASGKIVTTLRLSPDVIAKLKEGGEGWQARADALLRKALNL